MAFRRSQKTSHKPENLSIKDFYQMRNKVLILRQLGGVGDILMQRMMFEGFKQTFPGCHLTFSTPAKFKDISSNHPFLDDWVPSEEVDLSQYMVNYNISTACGKYEEKVGAYSDKNRSDIWANYCGVILDKHEMYVPIDEADQQEAKQQLEQLNPDGKPSVAFCPISAILSKTMTGPQIAATINGLRELGLFVYSTHTKSIPEFEKLKAPVIHGISLKKWMAYINAADSVVAVDTAAFHLGGGLKKPLVGVFAWTDGKIYGKYYNFQLVQKHRDNGDWDCGPCYFWQMCPKERKCRQKPCLTEITAKMIVDATERAINTKY